MQLKKLSGTIALCFALLLPATVVFAQNPYKQIIPLPKYSEQKVGSTVPFTLNSETVIVCKNKFLGSYLQARIKNILGTNIAVVNKNKVPKSIKGSCIIITEKNDYASFAKRIPGIDVKSFNDSSADKKEFYTLNVTPDIILIAGNDYGGMFNAIQTLLQLLPPQVYNFNNAVYSAKTVIPQGRVTDWPKYNYRGYMLDVSRTFTAFPEILEYLDWMSYNKINRFHWHLTDDEGWRIEIKKYPLLTEKGAWRGPGEIRQSCFGSGNKRYGGFYTQEQIKYAVKYAAERNIEIIPEIETPGHSTIIASCYPEIVCNVPEGGDLKEGANSSFSKSIWCVAKENNYKILDGIIKEVAKLFPSKTLNIGGDEVNHTNWENCIDCQNLIKEKGYKDSYDLHNYFVRRLETIVKKYGKTMAGWEELVQTGDLDPKTMVYIWHGAKEARAAVGGHHPCVMMVGKHEYIDMKQSLIERGHNWAAPVVPLDSSYSMDVAKIATPENNGKTQEENNADMEKYVIGVQAGLWMESGNRPINYAEYQTYPRLCALAEIGWGSAEVAGGKSDFQNFFRRLSHSHFKRMNNMGIRYRVQYPAVTLDTLKCAGKCTEQCTEHKEDTCSNSCKEDKTHIYKLTATNPYSASDAVIKYAIVAPETSADGLRGEPDTTNYKYIYRDPIITDKPDTYRFATFVSDTLHSIGVAQMTAPLHNYLKPEMTVESNKPLKKDYTYDMLKDFDPKTVCYFTGRGHKGDYFLFNFKEPVECSTIEIISGRLSTDYYGITNGYVEYSYDGENYIKGGDFFCNKAVAKPKEKVKSLRIVITDECDSYQIAVQDLRIY